MFGVLSLGKSRLIIDFNLVSTVIAQKTVSIFIFFQIDFERLQNKLSFKFRSIDQYFFKTVILHYGLKVDLPHQNYCLHCLIGRVLHQLWRLIEQFYLLVSVVLLPFP